MGADQHVFHYTNTQGWKAIRSQVTWRFLASTPPPEFRQKGAYFTLIKPTLRRILHKKLRIPREKQDYVFWFNGDEGLVDIAEYPERTGYILYSPVDYDVVRPRQRGEGTFEELAGRVP